MKKLCKSILLLGVILVSLRIASVNARAESATVDFTSGTYEIEAGSNGTVGISINADDTIGTYYVEIAYDSTKLTYVSGADQIVGEGCVALAGIGNGPQVGRRLVFRSETEGDGAVAVGNVAVLIGPEEARVNCDIARTGVASVHVLPAAEEAVEEEENVEETVGDEEIPEAEPEELPVNAAEPLNENAEDTAPAEPINTTMVNEEKPSEEEPALSQEFFEAGYQTINQDDEYYSANPINRFGLKYFGYSGTKLYLVLLSIVLLMILIVGVVVWNVKDITNKNNWSSYWDTGGEVNSGGSSDASPESDLLETNQDATSGRDNETPIISVRNLTKKFKVSTASVSGIKEYLIQKIKKEINYRELLALDNVSFDVYKGEVVGIIGTNGSGKSTLLKTVSGALEPTSGEVIVDRRKIQLLTLGTGFDMELTARENVYLNGAIIGYSKEFLDTHYDEIVAFAELDGFMEEKVKNFSSGMVSRLGFAIATAGDAAEILILDEVLSVGDEFFRKKSLARVQEMIHGGSTVLMVSHSMDTIQKNCSKVVWIEKGKMRAVGSPDDVCNKYQVSEL